MPWYAASLVANVCIILVEFINRGAVGNFWQTLPYTGLPILVAQWCLFTSWSGAPHWMAAWVMFVIGNSIMRVVAVHAFAGHEVGSWWFTTGGILVILCGSLLVKEGLQ